MTPLFFHSLLVAVLLLVLKRSYCTMPIPPPFLPHYNSPIPVIVMGDFVMPLLGYGTGSTGSSYEANGTMLHALSMRFHSIDCAAMHSNLKPVGSTIREYLDNEKSVTRKNLFISCKLDPESLLPGDVKTSTIAAINDLGSGYLDLLLVPDPFSAPCDIGDTWKALERMASASHWRLQFSN